MQSQVSAKACKSQNGLHHFHTTIPDTESHHSPELIWNYIYIPVVPHKAAADVSKIGNLLERLVVVNQGWQSEATDGPKGA